MADAKIVLGNGEVLMDLTADTVKPDKLLKDYTAHGADGYRGRNPGWQDIIQRRQKADWSYEEQWCGCR